MRKPENQRSSLAWKVAGHWQGRMLGKLLSSLILLAIGLLLALIVMAEHELLALGKAFPAAAIPPGTGVVVRHDDTPPEGLRGFTFPRRMGEIFPDARRRLVWDGSLPYRDRLGSVRYELSMPDSGGSLTLVRPMGDMAVAGFVIWMVYGITGLIAWLFEFSGSLRKARKLFRPLTSAPMDSSPDSAAPAQPPANAAPGAAPGDLAEVIARINVGRLDMRIDMDSCPRELSELAQAINSMLERIDEAYHMQSRFVSDASHELRTPISVIQGYAGLLDRWGKDDPKTLQESIDAIRSETARMKELVEQLLFLARGDNEAIPLRLERVNARGILEDIFRESEMIDPGHRWILRPGPDVILEADPTLLKQAVRILTDNAIKYSPPGTDITLGADLSGGEARIEVRDNGIGMQGEDIPRMFDRFYRSEPSRGRKTGGAGLGLSIAKWIVEQHHGHFDIASYADIGTRIALCLPTETPAQRTPVIAPAKGS